MPEGLCMADSYEDVPGHNWRTLHFSFDSNDDFDVPYKVETCLCGSSRSLPMTTEEIQKVLSYYPDIAGAYNRKEE